MSSSNCNLSFLQRLYLFHCCLLVCAISIKETHKNRHFPSLPLFSLFINRNGFVLAIIIDDRRRGLLRRILRRHAQRCSSSPDLLS